MKFLRKKAKDEMKRKMKETKDVARSHGLEYRRDSMNLYLTTSSDGVHFDFGSMYSETPLIPDSFRDGYDWLGAPAQILTREGYHWIFF